MYTHGGDCYRTQTSYDFSANINPLGMPKALKDAAFEGVLLSGRYPDPENDALVAAVANRFGMEASAENAAKHLCFGNGAGELIYLIARACAGNGISYGPTFTLYEEATVAAGGTFTYVNLRPEDGFEPTEELLARMGEDTSVCYLCNPNNPTGRTVPQELLAKFNARSEETKTYLVVDESFLPFVSGGTSLLEDTSLLHPYMIVLHSLTKIYAMPGLRLGYAYFGDERLAARVKELTQPWNVSVPAQAAGVAALSDKDFVKKTGDYIEAQKEYLIGELSGLTEELYAGKANFLLFRARPDLAEKLLAEDIMIRDVSSLSGLSAGWFRIAVRSESENRVLIRAMKKVLGDN